ncbi:hypothetical protein BATDEDRAFT_92081 [Batrachochytrium dendrobatidis JAM81]|uniref:Uncharacterized protein n=1 Tax=Batrachochytrium dendrobatidis (strain JAM81 / FGSC 10211) TaxID=684364 RepID=F4PCA6_BATDJ|nr:uncharacterized protein BATDEDRAFT_92081 [Batrachochytrium dendrobatidis JAM81]EGF77126.1 hypothetical protein BATDEDRAFT_92081 [Batrachochytrium dendrobatidis JAM81]|eukprot:XP_006682282.1 hypothetical protein BATDEDRAFT_92081 [Batrachochytrium dendrobatidis JAM81]
MKLAVTVLASILFACSVTTAKPVNPSATTSAEASTSTVIPTATESTKSKHRVLSYEGSEFSVDLSKLSKDDVKLIQEYLQTDQEYEEIKKACDSAKSEELNQKELLKRLDGESYELSLKYSNNEDDPVYQEEKEIINQKFDEEDEIFFSLQQKRRKLDKNLYHAGLLLHIARKELAELLFQNGPSTASLDSYRISLELDRNFAESIYQSFILRLNKQSGSDTQKASKSSKSHSRSRLWKTSKSKNERKSFSSPPSSEDSDESPV